MTDQRVPATMTTTSSSIIRANGLKERNISHLYIQRDKMRKKKAFLPKVIYFTHICLQEGANVRRRNTRLIGSSVSIKSYTTSLFSSLFSIFFFFFLIVGQKRHTGNLLPMGHCITVWSGWIVRRQISRNVAYTQSLLPKTRSDLYTHPVKALTRQKANPRVDFSSFSYFYYVTSSVVPRTPCRCKD